MSRSLTKYLILHFLWLANGDIALSDSFRFFEFSNGDIAFSGSCRLTVLLMMIKIADNHDGYVV